MSQAGDSLDTISSDVWLEQIDICEKEGTTFMDVKKTDIRRKKTIPFGKAVENTGEINFASLELIGFPNSTYKLYSDNGSSPVPEDSLTVTEFQK